MNPGGVGVDIKHNSYHRYLNRLKGKGPLRRGVIPPYYGVPIPFNRAFPVYGGKTVKTDIVTGCDCPDVPNNEIANRRIYGEKTNALQDEIYSVQFKFHEGDFVFATKPGCDDTLYKAKILHIQDSFYTIEFLDDHSIITTTGENLGIYFDCDCNESPSLEEYILANEYKSNNTEAVSSLYCEFLNRVTTKTIL
jgi:hypothetical protein